MFGVDSGVEEEDAEGAMGERTEWFEFNWTFWTNLSSFLYNDWGEFSSNTTVFLERSSDWWLSIILTSSFVVGMILGEKLSTPSPWKKEEEFPLVWRGEYGTGFEIKGYKKKFNKKKI
jgi:hypothetical protein